MAMALSAKRSMTFQNRIITSLGKYSKADFTKLLTPTFLFFPNEASFSFAWVLFPQIQCSPTPKITLDMAKDKSESVICTTMVMTYILPLKRESPGGR